MRHNKKNNHLGRKTAHRAAMLSNMASSLIMHKRIFTTVPKAKELRKYVEPLITKSKEDTTHSRREVFSKLQNKVAVTELFQTVSQKVADRPGGYTRIIKTGFRLGDNAAMCFVELVDFNENMLGEGKVKKTKTRRSRRKASDAAAVTAAADAPAAKKAKEVKTAAGEEVKVEDVKVEEVKDETVTADAVTDETVTADAVEEETPVAEAGEVEDPAQPAGVENEQEAAEDAPAGETTGKSEEGK